jgi:hypothetical protein
VPSEPAIAKVPAGTLDASGFTISSFHAIGL